MRISNGGTAASPPGGQDTAATEAAVSQVADAMPAIDAYVQAMTALPLGAQPIMLDGQQVGTFAPLGGTPQLQAALQAAQQECQSQSLVGDVLSFGVILSAASPVIGSNLETMVQVLDTVLQTGSPLTAAQLQQVQTAIQNVSQAISLLEGTTSAMHDDAAAFIPQITAAEAALNQGQGAIGAAIGQIDQWVQNTVLQYTSTPAIGDIVSEIGGQMVTALQALSTALGNASAAAEPASQGLATLEDCFAVISGWYGKITTQLGDATAEQAAQILEQLDLEDAQRFWSDLTQYVNSTGLWSVSSPP